MPRLRSSERAGLPDSAFAYIDSKGRRRLPIHDEPHVRAALGRFGRVPFEDEAAEERARKKLLNAAKKYGIVPVGFITGQIRGVRGRSGHAAALPKGVVTFLLTDIEDSTGLLGQLGDRYAGVLTDVRGVIRRAVLDAGGRDVDARADEFFAVFESAGRAVEAAVAIQRAMGARSWPDDLPCRVRVGLHTGRPTLTASGYIGLPVNTAARVCWTANGGQIVASGDTRSAAETSLPAGVGFRSLGRHKLAGLPRPQALYQVEADGLDAEFPRLRAGSPRRTGRRSGPTRGEPGQPSLFPGPGQAVALKGTSSGPSSTSR
jgi:class 3 adenylate cyclase